jgi:hypothetical protein
MLKTPIERKGEFASSSCWSDPVETMLLEDKRGVEDDLGEKAKGYELFA